MVKNGIVWLLLLLVGKIWSQDATQFWVQQLKQNPGFYGLKSEDLQSLRISDAYRSPEGWQFVYLQQQYNGIDIHLALLNMIVDADGKIAHLTHRFSDLSNVKTSSTPFVSARQAIERSAVHLGLPASTRITPAVVTRSLPYAESFVAPTWSKEVIDTRLMYLQKGDKLVLSREVLLMEVEEDHFWQVFVDATSGAILQTIDQIKRCAWDTPHEHAESFEARHNLPFNPLPPPFNSESYLVYPLYTESPLHGPRVTVTNPADALASPYGWHDINGVEGPEYTDTRGNNTTVQEDQNANDGVGTKSEGGQELNFSFDMDFERAPDANLKASMTNTFYWININHDIFYHYGFDEEAGNFQVNNYGRPGLANDAVIADVQDGRETNNARFYTYPDGRSGRMELYLWGDDQGQLKVRNSTGDSLTIIGVESGFSENNKLAAKGPIQATLIEIEDLDGNHLACRTTSPAKNGASLKGQLVLLDRGDCLFIEKVHYIQTLGALGAVVVNNVAGPAITMGGDGENITIPAIMVTLEESRLLRYWLAQGEVGATMEKYVSTTNLDSGLDNLIITHEYGHGISTRLSGGPSVNSCLNNDEQMGEGWSDYFGLMLTTAWRTAQPNDRRGIGNWLTRQDINGTGIRPYPYSYDLAINKLKYSDLPDLAIPHGVGSAWASMLWDMTWEIIAQEGLSEDIYRGQKGNNIALQLVIDALKIQPCSPGFVDGRDAILTADKLRYNSKHHYAIWKAFARRGLGFSASQGSASSIADGRAAFDLPTSVLTKTENFIATDSINRIILSWTVVQEIANKEYQIERSTDGKTFQIIGAVPGLDFSETPRQIVFYDLEVKPGILYYYRLTQVNQSGARQEIGTATAIILDVQDLVVFPNPTSGETQMVVNSRFFGPAQILLFNLAGQLLKAWSVNDASQLHRQYALDLKDLPDGMLILQVVTPAEKITSKLTLVH